MEKDWEGLPYESQLRLPITANVPNFFRWKILQVKLLLNDVRYLEEKHDIEFASTLYIAVQAEAEELCKKLTEEILTRQMERAKYVEED